MAVGLLIDTLVIRPILTPAVLGLLDRAALWPAGSRVGRSRARAGAVEAAAGSDS